MSGPIDAILDWLGNMGFEDGEGGMTDTRPARPAQIEQYRGIKELPDSEYRPTSLTKFQDQPFKSLKNFYPAKLELDLKDLAYKPLPKKGHIMDLSGKVRDTSIPDRDMFGFTTGENMPIESSLGLGGVGNAKVSAGRDDKGPYISVFDSWDFEEGPGHKNSGHQYGDLERVLLKRMGKPFNIYDRTYFKPYLEEYFPWKIFAPGDIELPPDPKNTPPRKIGKYKK